jgi:hypothetical protein
MMEFEQVRKKVNMSTLASTLIEVKPSLLPQWISDSHLNFASAY